MGLCASAAQGSGLRTALTHRGSVPRDQGRIRSGGRCENVQRLHRRGARRYRCSRLQHRCHLVRSLCSVHQFRGVSASASGSEMSQAMDDVKAACARGLVLAPVAALLLSVATLLLGNGLLGTLLIVRAGQEGFTGTISAMMSFISRASRSARWFCPGSSCLSVTSGPSLASRRSLR